VSDDHHPAGEPLRLPGFEEPALVVGPPSAGRPLRNTSAPFTVEVVRSKRRTRSVGAQLVGGVLTVTVPMWMNAAERDHWTEEMSARFRRKMSTDRIDLTTRARRLARQHQLSSPDDIRWVDNMRSRWGSCTPATKSIHLSSRLAAFPDWVIDYVIVHELAHLDVGAHDDQFWALVHRYPKAERAIGFLIAKSGDSDPDGA
jgi:predicted metal-dependent hydrolase